MNLFRKAIQNLDAHWRRPSYPLDFKLVREALVNGEELSRTSGGEDPGDVIAIYDHLIDTFFPRPSINKEKSVRIGSAILLYTLYQAKGSFVQKYHLIDALRTGLPYTDESIEIDEAGSLRVRIWQLRTHLEESGWSRANVKVALGFGYSLSPPLAQAVQRAVDAFKTRQRPPLNNEQREDAEKTVLGALEPLDDNPAKRICDALAAKGYLTYG
jgi:hypothetical protein